MIKGASKILFFGFVLVTIALLAFEGMYRYQVVDTYLPELRGYNEHNDLKSFSNKSTILIMGDSFSAGKYSYPSNVRKALIGSRVINSSVPGTGIVEANILAPRRFLKFKPSKFIYQVYVGNDLLDISPPINWDKIPLVRNAYWAVSKYLRSIRYLNYRLGQLWQPLKFPENQPMPKDEPFSYDRYNFREKLFFEADPWHLENQILVRKNRQNDYKMFLSKLRKLLSYCKPGACRSYILVIPQPCQVNERYIKNMELIGAKFSDSSKILSDEYPFIAGIKKFLRENDMEYVRLLNPLGTLREKEKEGSRAYYQNNSHLNSVGQKLIAEFLLEELKPLGSNSGVFE
jgi:hypothetical protein